MDRRRFLTAGSKAGLGMAAMPLLPRLISAPLLSQTANSGYRALVCVYLGGGNDGNNTVIPADNYYAQYAAGRGDLAIAQASLQRLNGTSSGRAFGLHPSLRNVASLYNSGQAAWLVNAGPLSAPYTKGQDPTSAAYGLFSHAAQSGEWQSATMNTTPSTGWAGRIADLLSSQASALSPVAISTAGWTLLGTGAKAPLASIGGGTNSIAIMNAVQAFSPALAQMQLPQGQNTLVDDIAQMQSGYFATTQNLLNASTKGAGFRTAFPGTSLGQQLQLVAQMINGRSAFDVNRQVFVSSVGGYDTHTSQLSYQASNLADLDAALGAFASAMQEIGMYDSVTLFTMTDFARSQQANSTGGTDHAWGNHHLILGGAVKGGQLFGTFPNLQLGGPDDFGTLGQWIPTTAGTQYTATMAKWLGVGGADLAMIFPELQNFSGGTLGILG